MELDTTTHQRCMKLSDYSIRRCKYYLGFYDIREYHKAYYRYLIYRFIISHYRMNVINICCFHKDDPN